MTRYKVWDPAVRLFHWALVAGFAANALFTDDESKLHQWIGYAVLGLVLFRLVWGFVGSPHARFADFPPDPGRRSTSCRTSPPAGAGCIWATRRWAR